MIGSECLSVKTQLDPPMRNAFIIYTILQMKKCKAQRSKMTCPMTYYEVLGKGSGLPMWILGGLPIQLSCLITQGPLTCIMLVRHLMITPTHIVLHCFLTSPQYVNTRQEFHWTWESNSNPKMCGSFIALWKGKKMKISGAHKDKKALDLPGCWANMSRAKCKLKWKIHLTKA